MAFCIKCGASMADDSKFCMMCGTPRDVQPVMEAPVMEAPVMEAPVVEAPVMEAPVMEAPVVEAPVMEAPAVEESVAKVAVSLSKESQPEVAQQGFAPAQSGVPQPSFVPVQSAPQQAYSTQSAYQQQYSSVPNGPRKSKKGPIIAIISAAVLAVVAIVVALILILGGGTVEVDLSKYVKIEYSGYDETGNAYVYLDESKLLVDILKAQGEDVTSTNKVSFSMKALMNSIELEQTNFENLTNGEKITITVKYDTLLMEDNDIEFKNGTKEYTVEGLAELMEVDPFEDITIKLSGTSPNGYVYYNNGSDIDCVRWSSFEFDKDDELKNGDTITLRVKPDSIEYALEKGYKYTATSKDYKVEGLDFYYESMAEISQEHMKQYEDEASLKFDNSMEWISYAEISDKKLLGTYFAKYDGYASNNIIVFVYTATLTSTEGNFDTTTIYVPVYLKVGCIKDGKLDYIYAYTDGYISTEQGYGSYTGYISGDLMYTEFIINFLSKNKYEVTASEGMPEFKEVTGQNILPAPGGQTTTPEEPSVEPEEN